MDSNLAKEVLETAERIRNSSMLILSERKRLHESVAKTLSNNSATSRSASV